MTRMRTLVTAALVALLVAGLAGSGGVTAAEPRAVNASIMVPASAFSPTDDDWSYRNVGYLMASGSASFVATLSFPVPEVSIRRLYLYAYDMDAHDICLYLYRVAPAGTAIVVAGQVCTAGTSTTNPQILTTTEIAPRRVGTATQGSYLQVSFSGGSGDYSLKLYGVKVFYSYEEGA